MDLAEDDGQGDQDGPERTVEKVVEAKVDCRVFHKWRVSCARRDMGGVRWLDSSVGVRWFYIV